MQVIFSSFNSTYFWKKSNKIFYLTYLEKSVTYNFPFYFSLDYLLQIGPSYSILISSQKYLCLLFHKIFQWTALSGKSKIWDFFIIFRSFKFSCTFACCKRASCILVSINRKRVSFYFFLFYQRSCISNIFKLFICAQEIRVVNKHW